MPRRYGGYEFDASTFMRMTQELSRGCVSTGWCVSLASAHALQIASWWGEQAQAEIFGDGDFRCAAVAAPIGTATRIEGGWELRGKVAYASGIPYSTHYMGQALIAGEDGNADRANAAVRRAAQRVHGARRLGGPARPEGLGFAEHRLRGRHGSPSTGRSRTR